MMMSKTMAMTQADTATAITIVVLTGEPMSPGADVNAVVIAVTIVVIRVESPGSGSMVVVTSPVVGLCLVVEDASSFVVVLID